MAIDSGEKTYLSHTAQQVDDAIDAVASKVSDVAYSGATGKLQKTIGSNTTDILTVDATPTENSTNPVKSGGVYTMLAAKQDTLKMVDKEYKFGDYTFVHGHGTGNNDGKFYIPSADLPSISGITQIWSISIVDWAGLMPTEDVMPYVSSNGTKVGFMSNVETFTTVSAKMTIRIIGK